MIIIIIYDIYFELSESKFLMKYLLPLIIHCDQSSVYSDVNTLYCNYDAFD